MTGSPDHIKRKIRQLPRPLLSPELKAAVMTEASLRPATATWWDRAWYSTAWRLAAAGALLTVLVLDHLSAGMTPMAGPGPEFRAAQDQAQVARLGEEFGMSPELARGLASRVELVPLTARQPRPGDLSQGFQ
jgi:hypothetical protein